MFSMPIFISTTCSNHKTTVRVKSLSTAKNLLNKTLNAHFISIYYLYALVTEVLPPYSTK